MLTKTMCDPMITMCKLFVIMIRFVYLYGLEGRIEQKSRVLTKTTCDPRNNFSFPLPSKIL